MVELCIFEPKDLSLIKIKFKDVYCLLDSKILYYPRILAPVHLLSMYLRFGDRYMYYYVEHFQIL